MFQKGSGIMTKNIGDMIESGVIKNEKLFVGKDGE